MATFGELVFASSMRTWSDRPGMRLVKVLSPSARNHAEALSRSARNHAGDPPPPRITGYITQEKYLYGMTASQIERTLGLRPGELAQMAHIFTLSRLPTAAEVDFRLSAVFPDGKPMEATQWAAHLKARDDYRLGLNLHERSMVPVVQSYPPGSAMVPQWCLTKGIAIPAKALVATVTAQFPFPRENGSIKPYTPHDRGPIR